MLTAMRVPSTSPERGPWPGPFIRWSCALVLALLAGCGESASPGGPVEDAAGDGPQVADAAPDAAADMAPPADAGTPDLGPRPTVEQCFAEIGGDLGPNYTQFNPVIGRHCHGTDHQTITDIQRVVFLGDSVTAGTPPTQRHEIYRALLTEALTTRFGPDLIIDNCSKFGARTDDFLREGGQIPDCFPEGTSPLRTLVIFTMGGNDIAAWAGDAETPAQAVVLAEEAATLLDDAIAWFKAPGRFPAGISVIFANPYEFTDATGDLESCELAALAGFSGNWLAGAGAVILFNERFMQTAVRHQVDMIFTLEAFCGHGFRADDPAGQCYRGPDTETWFDLTCIHPTPVGHRVIADMFLAVIDE